MSLKIHCKNNLTLKSKTGNVLFDNPGYVEMDELHLLTPLAVECST